MSRYFKIQELVCPHVLAVHGNKSWRFIDSRLIQTLDTIRERINRPIFVNYGNYTQRGLRCILCPLVKAKIEAGELYLSAHLFGKAADFNVQGIESEVMRLWLAKNANFLPWPIRLESGVSWVHLDIFPSFTDQKVYIFRP